MKTTLKLWKVWAGLLVMLALVLCGVLSYMIAVILAGLARLFKRLAEDFHRLMMQLDDWARK